MLVSYYEQGEPEAPDSWFLGFWRRGMTAALKEGSFCW